jgi:hypothetical protein
MVWRGRPFSSSWKKLVRRAASMRLTKRRRMRSSSRLVTSFSASSMRARIAACSGPALASARIEAGVEELHEIGRDGAVAGQRPAR